jgi:protocatechuate 4,5-dioxygenase alpha chain
LAAFSRAAEADAMGQLDPDHPIAGTYIFDWRMSRSGYRINKLAYSLHEAANRAAFKADEEAYYDRYRLTAEEEDLLRRRDFLGMIKAGANIYMLLKLGAATGNGLYHMGAQQRGETLQEFLATRNVGSAT